MWTNQRYSPAAGNSSHQAFAIATIEALVTLTMAAAGAAVLSVWLAKGPALASARGLALIAFSASVAALASMIANALLSSRLMWSQLKDRGHDIHDRCAT